VFVATAPGRWRNAKMITTTERGEAEWSVGVPTSRPSGAEPMRRPANHVQVTKRTCSCDGPPASSDA